MVISDGDQDARSQGILELKHVIDALQTEIAHSESGKGSVVVQSALWWLRHFEEWYGPRVDRGGEDKEEPYSEPGEDEKAGEVKQEPHGNGCGCDRCRARLVW